MFDNTCSPAEARYWLAKKYIQVKDQTEAVDTEIIEISNSDSEEKIQNLDLCECEIIDELNFRELEQIPQVTHRGTSIRRVYVRRRYRLSRERQL